MLAIIGLAAVSALLIPIYALSATTTADIVNESTQSLDIHKGQLKAADLANDAVMPNIHRVIGTWTNVAPNSFKAAATNCPQGEAVTGGGIVGGRLTIEDTFPSNDRQGQGGVFNYGSQTEQFRVDAVCIGPST